jgi:hypothetical protein
VEKGCRTASGWVLSHIPNEAHRLWYPPLLPTAGSLTERLRRAVKVRYPSPVCSIQGDAIDRIAEAIDQLASDVGEAGGPELAARVAELWLMVSALDPELARRQQRYTTSADDMPPHEGTPPAGRV